MAKDAFPDGSAGMRQHQTLAQGNPIEGQDGNFGVQSMGSGRSSPDAAMNTGKTMKDEARPAGRPMHDAPNRMPAPDKPDHGPHRHR